MKVWEAAVQVLRESGNPGVMTGDVYLCHEIAEKLGWEHQGYRTPQRVIRALSKTPGILQKGLVPCGDGRLRLTFDLPDQLTSASGGS